jgi:hypothetical protein
MTQQELIRRNSADVALVRSHVRDLQVVIAALVVRGDRHGLAAPRAKLIGDRLVVQIPAAQAPADPGLW